MNVFRIISRTRKSHSDYFSMPFHNFRKVFSSTPSDGDRSGRSVLIELVLRLLILIRMKMINTDLLSAVFHNMIYNFIP
eukprot:SAG31_NODE_4415_length_3229_cov_11.320330_4_plen_79_part_00